METLVAVSAENRIEIKKNQLTWIYFDFKGIYYCPIEIIKGLTDKGQLQYHTKLKGPQVGN